MKIKSTKGQLSVNQHKIAIVVARFNDLITTKLLEGAIDAFSRMGGNSEDLEIVWVPGAFEIPVIAKSLIQTRQLDAVVTLGCVIKGATDHYDYVCSAVTSGVNSLAIESGIPVLFGVLTVENLEQAFDRAGGKMGNKGFEVMSAAIETVNVKNSIMQLSHIQRVENQTSMS